MPWRHKAIWFNHTLQGRGISETFKRPTIQVRDRAERASNQGKPSKPVYVTYRPTINGASPQGDMPTVEIVYVGYG
jgi:hypothetical protein